MQPALGEDVEAEVAALLGPFVVLFGQDGADEADERGPVGEDADDVGAAADLSVEAFVGGCWTRSGATAALGNAVNAKMSAWAASRWWATAGSLSASASRIRSNWACTASVSGWSQTECSNALTQAHALFGVADIRFAA